MPGRKSIRIFQFVLLTAVLFIFESPVRAYETTGNKWPRPFTTYRIDPNNDANLRIEAGQSKYWLDHAFPRWNQASWFGFVEVLPYDGSGNIVSTANFQTTRLCDPPRFESDGSPGVTCGTVDGNSLTRVRTYMNTSPTYSWNTAGIMNRNVSPRQADFMTVAFHEIGHWYFLDHDADIFGICRVPDAVMCPDWRTKWYLHEDDKEGATQIYGPFTGFEWQQARGLFNTIAYRNNCVGYFNSDNPGPELSPVSQEFGIRIPSDTQYERMAGFSQANYSYCYFQLFTSDKDRTRIDQSYVTIQSGMKLTWLQYNFQESTMSLDFEMTNGSTLRDSRLSDQFGVNPHPAMRGNYPLGQWLYFEVDLTPLKDKTIRQFMIAYDNGNNGIINQFRGYFDDIKLVY